jgi:hypothetical protein
MSSVSAEGSKGKQDQKGKNILETVMGWVYRKVKHQLQCLENKTSTLVHEEMELVMLLIIGGRLLIHLLYTISPQRSENLRLIKTTIFFRL